MVIVCSNERVKPPPEPCCRGHPPPLVTWSSGQAQEEMEKLQCQLLALPARRADADNKRHFWWAVGATLVAIVGPILLLTLFSVGAWVAFGSFLGLCVLAAVCLFVGMLRGMVAVPVLDDDVIESETRKRAKDKLNVSA